jgi:hypothetical protein
MKKLIVSALLALSVTALQAAGTPNAKPNGGSPSPSKNTKAAASPELPVPEDTEQNNPSGYVPTSGVSFTAGGGYFVPMSGISDVFKPSWMARLSVRNNNVAGTLFGLGFDLSYSALKDKDVSGGRMIFICGVPHVTAAFSMFDLFDVNAKGGAGISALVSKVNGTSGGSAAFTLAFGGGISRVFNQHFIMGLETDYHYYMQRNSSSTIGCDLYMGYRL